jgi:heat shock protein HslJ
MKILYYSMAIQAFIPVLKIRSSIVVTLFYCCMLHACKTSQHTNVAQPASTKTAIIPADSLIKKQESGIDFFATGNNPVSWILELDFESRFTFMPSGSQQLITVPSPATRQTNPGADLYLSQTDSGTMKVLVYDEPCSNEKSQQVTVTINNKYYTGCGKYLYDYRLNDVWVLQYIDNMEPEQQDYKKLPRLQFDLSKKTMTGYDGCGSINSAITVNGNHIKFAAFANSKQSCSENKTTKLFTTMLSNHTVDYKIDNGRLFIYLINDSKLTFTKAE